MDVAFLTYGIRKLRTEIVEGASPGRSRLIRCIDYLFYDIDYEKEHAINERHRLKREVWEEKIQAIHDAFLHPRSCKLVLLVRWCLIHLILLRSRRVRLILVSLQIIKRPYVTHF